MHIVTKCDFRLSKILIILRIFDRFQQDNQYATEGK